MHENHVFQRDKFVVRALSSTTESGYNPIITLQYRTIMAACNRDTATATGVIFSVAQTKGNPGNNTTPPADFNELVYKGEGIYLQRSVAFIIDVRSRVHYGAAERGGRKDVDT